MKMKVTIAALLVFAGLTATNPVAADGCNSDVAAPECGPSPPGGLGGLPGSGGSVLPNASQLAGLGGAAVPVCVANSCGQFAGSQCGWWQMYEIDAEVTSGTGMATASVKCGDSTVECTLSSSGDLACHAEFATGPGEFECSIKTNTGNLQATGTCKDPANPYAVYRVATGSELGER